MTRGLPVSPQDVADMRLALALARESLDSEDVPVGAVVLSPEGTVLGRGRNAREERADPTAHAEILALREAGAAVGEWRLAGCTLVVTLEPCPMCAGALLQARVRKLVFGAWDPKAGAAGSLMDIVRDRRFNHQIEVIPEVLEAECSALLRDFFDGRRQHDRAPDEPIR
jgi:tRNA(adenine34) deaminase